MPPNLALNLNNIAGLYYAQGLYTEAEPLFKRSLAIREKIFGTNNLDVAVSLNNLAEYYGTVDKPLTLWSGCTEQFTCIAGKLEAGKSVYITAILSLCLCRQLQRTLGSTSRQIYLKCCPSPLCA